MNEIAVNACANRWTLSKFVTGTVYSVYSAGKCLFTRVHPIRFN